MWINLLLTTCLSVKDYLRLFYSLNKLCSSTLFMLFTAFSSVQINQYLTLEYTLTYILTKHHHLSLQTHIHRLLTPYNKHWCFRTPCCLYVVMSLVLWFYS